MAAMAGTSCSGSLRKPHLIMRKPQLNLVTLVVLWSDVFMRTELSACVVHDAEILQAGAGDLEPRRNSTVPPRTAGVSHSLCQECCSELHFVFLTLTGERQHATDKARRLISRQGALLRRVQSALIPKRLRLKSKAPGTPEICFTSGSSPRKCPTSAPLCPTAPISVLQCPPVPQCPPVSHSECPTIPRTP